MSDFLKFTNDYINKIREDEICKEYFRQKEIVTTQYLDLKKQIDEFRYRNYKLQNETDADRLFDETDRFEREYEEFCKNPIVSDFMAAELAFCRMYQDVQSVLGEAFAKDFDLSN